MDRKDLFLEIGAAKWSTFWSGGNNKYPAITVKNLDSLTLLEKLTLLEAILDERDDICRFLREEYQYSEGAEEALAKAGGGAAIFIPSGGKNGEWIWRKSDKTNDAEWWWVRMAREGVPVFLVVSAGDFAVYQKGCHEKGIHVIGYGGFGIGCGRSVCVRHLVKHSIIGVITDDRTGSVDCLNEPVEKLEQFKTMISLSDAGIFCSVMFKFKCNILTIVRGDKPLTPKKLKKGMFCFPPLFMSSKEDLSLALIISKMAPKKYDETNDLYQILVHTDTSNPVYENSSVFYEGRKGEVLNLCCKSIFFRDASTGEPLSAQLWKSKYEFKNMWDVIKMQESAMFQLMDALGPISSKDDDELLEVFFRIVAKHFWT